ncbi:hypothetical protein [Desulfonatronum thioautotrophicum]|uniref:hypothetical protein n=1 Tax=Desulfonatronum thioautotrophicum TaxID=617001 RepID=UPI0005EB7338|nr:hypothetical protein [Desulfonatronum thioautotrophicum]
MSDAGKSKARYAALFGDKSSRCCCKTPYAPKDGDSEKEPVQQAEARKLKTETTLEKSQTGETKKRAETCADSEKTTAT